MPSIPFSAVILAAGKGSRMHSTRPKVLHLLAGKPMVQHVIDTVAQLGAQQCYLVYGHEGEQLKEALCHQPLHWVLQTEQRGTGHALQQVLPDLPTDETLLILYGDVPLISTETLQRLLAAQPPNGISLLTAHLAVPAGYGRIMRQNGQIVAIVEQQEATAEQQQIKEINSGILAANSADLKRWLSQLDNQNASGEYYLTDIIALAHAEGCGIHSCHPTRSSEVQGVNTCLQLAHLEREYQIFQAQQLLLAGVTVCDPARFDLRGELLHGQDVVIESNVILQGRVKLGDRVIIGTGCLLIDCTIGDDCQIKPYTVIEKSSVGARCSVGPFAHLRAGSELHSAAKVGNFVEIKKTRLGQHSKVNHLSYLGDADIGARVNIGAGTITCNYNGVDKLPTMIGNDVFVGADTQLVAPVTIASGATIGAGTTVTQDVAAEELVLSRVAQRHIRGWQRPTKKTK